ncbi:MAG: HlyD family efflux transporter periplasmic adaptor subunit [Phycisphaerales bacterium]|nr:HlyD family efflux transporter periplasmic adaptor subunit [Phycisphaerales bacterium]
MLQRLGAVGAALFTLAAVSGLGNGMRSTGVEAVTRPSLTLELAFALPGVVAEAMVKPGETVAAGQPLLRLDDREARANLEQARMRADSSLEAEAERLNYELARVRDERARQAYDKGAASDLEVRETSLEAQRSKLAWELFVQRQVEARLRFDVATVEFERHTLRAPVAARVEAVDVDPGEMVEVAQAVVRLIVLETLQLDAPFPVGETLGLHTGDRAWVEVTRGDEVRIVEGKVIFVSGQADAGLDTCAVRIEFPNTAAVPAGTIVRAFLAPPV